MKPTRGNLLSILMLTLLATCSPGCAIFSWFVAQFSPPQRVKALYKLPKDKKIVVYVDDTCNPVNYEPIKHNLTEKLSEELIAHGIATRIVSYDELVDLMIARADFFRMSISQIARELGADVVVHISIDRFSLKDNQVSPLWRGRFKTRVRVVDSLAGQLWPEDRPAGYPVNPVEIEAGENPSPSYATELAGKLADIMAERIARLFYDHKVSTHAAYSEP